ncbi:MAG: hypothetical protein ACXIUV_03995 [Alkalilacustris sp.]
MPDRAATISALKYTATAAVGVLAALVMVWMLLDFDRDFELTWNNWLPELRVAAPTEPELARQLDLALGDPGAPLPPDIAGVLRAHGIYRHDDPDLIGRFERIAPDSPSGRRILALMHQRQGPFRLPEMLDGAEPNYLAFVLTHLDARHPMVAEVWAGFILASMPFVRQHFEMRLVPMDVPPVIRAGSDGHGIERGFVCHGDDLFDKYLLLHRPGREPRVVLVDGRRPEHQCAGGSFTLAELFVRPAEVALPRPVYEHFFPPENGPPEGAPMVFARVYPAGVAPLATPGPRSP